MTVRLGQRRGLIRGARIAAALLITSVAIATATMADERGTECFSADVPRRTAGCSALLDLPGLDSETRAVAHAQRALAYALMGQNAQALHDYDASIALNPNSSIVLNNRAWALFRLGRGRDGWPDVERALELDPGSEHAYDTRAHIRQEAGQQEGALSDYRNAMRFGGARMIKLYQCGLQSSGLYSGPISGIESDGLVHALKACIERPGCDPLPPDEECRPSTS